MTSYGNVVFVQWDEPSWMKTATPSELCNENECSYIANEGTSINKEYFLTVLLMIFLQVTDHLSMSILIKYPIF